MNNSPLLRSIAIARLLVTQCAIAFVLTTIALAQHAQPSKSVSTGPNGAPLPTSRQEQSCSCNTPHGGYPCPSACQNCMMGVDCLTCCGEEARWHDMKRMPSFNAYGQGGYAGPPRTSHLSTYRLRPGDQLQVIYLITRRQNRGEYRLAPGDTLIIESVADQDLLRGNFENGLDS